ncbi:hypothetical protein GCM10011399_11000 [Subtercola lobariae]|uniref:Uncharacterized protein n=1 Tax=Subtercola lobariae TaxID=1588641 RepID=A0A917B4Y9_9MICO|nr:hypothetical protein GCM10011399_11000 [Subtercola lobariae]
MYVKLRSESYAICGVYVKLRSESYAICGVYAADAIGTGPQKRLSARGRSERLNLEPGVTAARL